jgi:hypothetical protein
MFKWSKRSDYGSAPTPGSPDGRWGDISYCVFGGKKRSWGKGAGSQSEESRRIAGFFNAPTGPMFPGHRDSVRGLTLLFILVWPKEKG